MNELPAPLTPPNCDLSDFQYMELDVRRLRDSKFAASVDGEAFRAGVLLWCAAWHQIPAGSLPDDDIELANLAGYGRVIKEWKKVREGALTGFIKCSDGRLYHEVIAEKALSAFQAKLRHAYEKLKDRIRKENSIRAKDNLPPLGIPTFEQWNSGTHSAGIPPEQANNSAGIPSENSLRGKREGKEQNGTEQKGEGDLIGSDPNGSGSKPPKITDPDEIIFGYGVPLLVNAGNPEKHARSFLGKLRKEHTDEAVIDKLRQCLREKPIDPLTWLAAALPPHENGGKQNKQEALEKRNQEVAERLAAGVST